MMYDFGILTVMALAVLGILYAEIDTSRKGVRYVGRTRVPEKGRDTDTKLVLDLNARRDEALHRLALHRLSGQRKPSPSDLETSAIADADTMTVDLLEVRHSAEILRCLLEIDSVDDRAETRQYALWLEDVPLRETLSRHAKMIEYQSNKSDAFERRLRRLEEEAVRRQASPVEPEHESELEPSHFIN